MVNETQYLLQREVYEAERQAKEALVAQNAALTARLTVLSDALVTIAKYCWATVQAEGMGEDEYADALLHASALARAALEGQ